MYVILFYYLYGKLKRIELYIFSTLCVLADKFLTDTLNDLRDNKITVDEKPLVI